MKLVYVIGAPASGKTTLMMAALAGMGTGEEREEPIPHVRYGHLWHLGRHRHPFGGTDTLSMSINPRAVAWMEALAGEQVVVIGEGDRLANRRFLDSAEELVLVLVDTPAVTARRRSVERSTQSDAWWRGRATKVANLCRAYPVERIDGTAPISEGAAKLRSLWGR